MLPTPFNTLPRTALKLKKLAKGELLFRQSDAPHALYFLQTGQVKLLRHTESGETIIIHNARSEETFAEASLFSNAYHCDAVAHEASDLIVMDKAQILKAMRQNSLFAFALCARFSGQIQTYRRRLELLAIKSAPQRVHAAIADNMLTGSVTSLAGEIGLTHEATYRALTRLTQNGALVKTGRGRYELAGKDSQTNQGISP